MMQMIGRTFVVAFLLYFVTTFDGVKAQLNICPVHGRNRTIQPGYPLIQCFPFHQTGACCQRYEEQAVFNKFSELRFTGSDSCEARMSNLLCYICSPNQANWYSNNKVTVCGEFCNSLWDHCFNNARFGNNRISSLYRNGRDFCETEGFIVQDETDRNCYNLHPSLIPAGAATLKITGMFIISFASLVTYILMFF